MICNKCQDKNYTILFLTVVLIALLYLLGRSLCTISELRTKYAQLDVKLFQQTNINRDLELENLDLLDKKVQFENKYNSVLKNPLQWVKKNYKSYNLEVTAYSPSVDECDDTPFIAASGKRVDDFTVAVSQNMRKGGWGFGKFLYIPEFDQFYLINDVMNKRYTKRIDLFKWTKSEARDFGYKKDMEVYLIK